MKTYVYIDGFNLYHGCLQHTMYKWLNIRILSEIMLPGNDIEIIKYFTAKVSAPPDDPDQPTRQMLYWRALNTIRGVEVIKGTFYENIKPMPLADDCKRAVPGQFPRKRVKVVKREEKGSDVNLASHLLMDGVSGKYGQAVLITNDSDLLTPLKIVRYELKLPVGIINPHEYHSKVLKPHATFLARIRPSDLQAAQFSDILTDHLGSFHKPPRWGESPPCPKIHFSFLKNGRGRLK